MSNGTQQPTQFNLQGGGVTVSYSSTSFTGAPQFSYRGATHSVDRSGDEIRSEDTEIGTLVTIDIIAAAETPDVETLPSASYCRGSTWARTTSRSPCRRSGCAPPIIRRPSFLDRSSARGRHTRPST